MHEMGLITRLRHDAEAAWRAAIAAVTPEQLVARRLACSPAGGLLVDGMPLGPPLDLDACARIIVVGGGKAAAGLAAGVEMLLGPERLLRQDVSGLVSVPEGCTLPLERIEARATRPAAANLPTPAVVAATHEILAAVAAAGPRDLVIAVITGGGSALLAAPRTGVTLEEKIALTKRLSESGADIVVLNAARSELSLVKGGGLAAACRAGRLVVLVLSDVMGDDLRVIASGPCMPRDPTTQDGTWTTPTGCLVQHLLLGSNATAVAAATAAVTSAGYDLRPAPLSPDTTAETTGSDLAAAGLALVAEATASGRPLAIVGGGEATVTVPAVHGRGGRNQQTILAAIDAVRARAGRWPAELLVASIGTDGEDGPTDAAGGRADMEVVAAIERLGLDVSAAVARCDAYPLLDVAGGLIRTGPTGTNVADVRIVLARPTTA
jgi:hydroxypyruvate reductase